MVELVIASSRHIVVQGYYILSLNTPPNLGGCPPHMSCAITLTSLDYNTIIGYLEPIRSHSLCAMPDTNVVYHFQVQIHCIQS